MNPPHPLDGGYPLSGGVRALLGELDRALRFPPGRNPEETWDAGILAGFLRHLLEDPRLAAYRLDREGRLVAVEGRVFTQAGNPGAVRAGQSAFEVFRDDPEVLAAVRRALGGERSQCRVRLAGGAFFEAAYTPLSDAEGHGDGAVCILIDATGQESAVARLRESEALLRESQTVASIGSYRFEVATGCWVSSPALDAILGIDAHAPKTVDSWAARVHPEDRQGMLDHLLLHVLRDRQPFDREYRILRGTDGELRWVHGLGVLDIDGEGRPAWMLGTIQDITSRKVAEQELWLKNWALEGSQSAQALSDLEGRLTYVNRKFLEWWGYSSSAEVLGRQAREFAADPEEIERLIVHLRGRDFWSGEILARRRDGSSFPMDLRTHVVRDREGRSIALLASVIDLTDRKRGEAELQRNRALLDEAVAAAQIGFFEHFHLTDEVYWSPELRRIYGWDADEVVTFEKILDAVHPDDRNSIREAIARAHDPAGDGRYRVGRRVLHRDGSIRWLETRSRTWFEGEGAARRAVRTSGIVIDVTDQRRIAEALAESEERLRLALAGTRQGLYDLDLRTGEAVVNPEYALMLGRDPETFRETNEAWRERLHPDDVAPVYQTYLDYVAGRVPIYRVEFRQRLPDGSWKWILSLGKIVSYDSEGRPLRMLGTHTDITERKEAEQVIARARDELEARVVERTRELRELNESLARANRAAEEASRAKSSFLAMMSHEIRTPLNGVTSVLHLLQQDALSPQQRRRIELAGASAKTLLRVINDILDFSKVEAGKLELRPGPTPLWDTIQQTAGSFAEAASARGLAWELDLDPRLPRWVETDGGRLSQVLGNLIGNAVKFTETGSIQVRIFPVESNPPGRVRFEVIDTGEGIAADALGRLFKPFSQVDSASTRRHGGTGLGLGICRHLVELMGGTLGVESQVGRGSTFWFELPLQAVPDPVADPDSLPLSAPPASPVPAMPASRGPLSAARAVVAEDNEINQELMREVLSAAGIDCDCVTTGAGAIRAALSGRYDVVFMDMVMPGMDGCAAARAIREGEARRVALGQSARHVIIIAMATQALGQTRADCLASGMDDLLTKPIDPDEVLARCRRWLGERRRG